MDKTILFLAQAAPTGGAGGGRNTRAIESTPLWDLLSTLLASAGVLLVLFGIAKIAFQMFSGKSTGAWKTGGSIVLAGALLFNISLVFNILNGAGSIVTTVVETFTSLVS